MNHNLRLSLVLKAQGAWDEAQHPRDKDGKFTEGASADTGGPAPHVFRPGSGNFEILNHWGDHIPDQGTTAGQIASSFGGILNPYHAVPPTHNSFRERVNERRRAMGLRPYTGG